LSRLLLFVYFLESGLLLLVVPWSVFWERNLFVGWFVPVEAILLNHFVRGAISGIGVLCLAASIAELLGVWRRRSAVTQRPATAPAGDADVLR
jgi:hypothetical protein